MAFRHSTKQAVYPCAGCSLLTAVSQPVKWQDNCTANTASPDRHRARRQIRMSVIERAGSISFAGPYIQTAASVGLLLALTVGSTAPAQAQSRSRLSRAQESLMKEVRH